ncbi:MAG: ATP-binding protein, partial [Gammaproteobacteria bacterium]
LESDDVSISIELRRRLTAAGASHSAAQRIRADRAAAAVNAREAREQVESVQARLRPLFERAGVATTEALLSLIDRSDRRRVLANAIEAARESISAGSDGLSLPEIAAEVDAIDVSALPGSLGQVNQALAESVDAQATLASELSAARAALAAISGSPDAAVAESKRQEALACMADASDRYLKVATASKLLRWAIDRYRERKQGPMLSRASAIFSQLTLGGFSKLIVDYEKPMPSLAALRAGGQVVEIEGMSEGTCDQLYLALRLAALELHLQHATALPFIADDLFVNFDDMRAEAGLRALGELARRTQVVFLSHHDHLVPIVQEVFGPKVNIVSLQS